MKQKPLCFVILSYPRTGSTYLVKILNSSKNVICHSEIFHKSKSAFEKSFLNDLPLTSLNLVDRLIGTSPIEKLFSLRQKNPIKFLSHIYNQQSNAVGFKIFPDQNEIILTKILKDPTIKKVVLTRKNLLRSYVSQQLAMQSGRWDRHSICERPILQRMILDIDEFEKYERYIDAEMSSIQNILLSQNQSFLSITYEEMIDEFPIQKFANFLDVPLDDVSFEVDQEKQNPFSLSEILENYDSIHQSYKGTSREKYL